MYIHMYIYTYVYIYMYVYIYIYRWHEVSSDKCTMAFNFWFPSIIQELLHGNNNNSDKKGERDGIREDSFHNNSSTPCNNNSSCDKKRGRDRIREDTFGESSSKMASYLLRASFQTLLEVDMKKHYEHNSKISHFFCKTGVGDNDNDLMTKIQFETFMIDLHEKYHRCLLRTSESISIGENQTNDQDLYDMEDSLVASSYQTMSRYIIYIYKYMYI
jgi:hypothetical protein